MCGSNCWSSSSRIRYERDAGAPPSSERWWTSRIGVRAGLGAATAAAYASPGLFGNNLRRTTLHEINELPAPISFHAALGAALVFVVCAAGLAVVELARRALGRPLEARGPLPAGPVGLFPFPLLGFLP